MLLVVAPLVYAEITSFDNRTNGFEPQTDFEDDLEVFQADDTIDEGLGPVYNARSCGDCHANTIFGGSSQINEIRAGRFDGTTFTDHPGGSLINDRAIDPSIQEQVFTNDDVHTFRTSPTLLGAGYVEVIPDSEFTRIRTAQPAGMKGTIINVPVLEAPGTTRIGRFGWKDQHASLLSFSADAYRNEVGITSPLAPTENRFHNSATAVAAFDTVPDPEDPGTTANPFGEDVEAFTRFMRSLRVPIPNPAPDSPSDVAAGEILFRQVGCDNCHTITITTAAEGTSFNGGNLIVPAALASKNIHPYSDFMLHDVGTGDGIVQNGGPGTRNKMRTAPLWGLRARTRFMHDGANVTPRDAILRHAGEAAPVITSYGSLTLTERQQILAFIGTL
jgi:CxxC motif-containing protein (DUF1111 family)